MSKLQETTVIRLEDLNLEDVLLGKGKSFSGCVGTIAFKALVEARLGAYLDPSCSSNDKTHLTMEVLNTVQEAGGRFLIQSQGHEGEYSVLASSKARLKVRDTFRDCIKNISKKRRPSMMLNRIGLSQKFSPTDTFGEIVHKAISNPRVQLFLSQKTSNMVPRCSPSSTLLMAAAYAESSSSASTTPSSSSAPLTPTPYSVSTECSSSERPQSRPSASGEEDAPRRQEQTAPRKACSTLVTAVDVPSSLWNNQDGVEVNPPLDRLFYSQRAASENPTCTIDTSSWSTPTPWVTSGTPKQQAPPPLVDSSDRFLTAMLMQGNSLRLDDDWLEGLRTNSDLFATFDDDGDSLLERVDEVIKGAGLNDDCDLSFVDSIVSMDDEMILSDDWLEEITI